MNRRAAFPASLNDSPGELGNVQGIEPGKPFFSFKTDTATLNEMRTAAIALN